MHVEDLEGIANVSYTVQTTETLTWGTSTDWDNAAAEARVQHPSGTIELRSFSDNFDDNSFDTSLWADRSNSLGNVAEQNSRLEFQFGSGSDDRPYCTDAAGLVANNGVSLVYEADIWATTTGGQQGLVPWWDGQASGTYATPDDGLDMRAWNGELYKKEGGTGTLIASWTDSVDTSPATYRVELVGDASSFNVTIYKNGSQVSATTGHSASFSSNLAYLGWYGRETDSETRVDNASVWMTVGFLETATKSFSSTTQPDLQNLSYSLNNGAIDLKVIGSPGTPSEEVVTQTLDGATSYKLTWSNSHSDFRLRPELDSTADYTMPPTFNQGELVG